MSNTIRHGTYGRSISIARSQSLGQHIRCSLAGNTYIRCVTYHNHCAITVSPSVSPGSNARRWHVRCELFAPKRGLVKFHSDKVSQLSVGIVVRPYEKKISELPPNSAAVESPKVTIQTQKTTFSHSSGVSTTEMRVHDPSKLYPQTVQVMVYHSQQYRSKNSSELRATEAPTLYV